MSLDKDVYDARVLEFCKESLYVNLYDAVNNTWNMEQILTEEITTINKLYENISQKLEEK